MTRKRQVRFWLIGLAVFLGLLYLLSSILLPFVAGLAVAYFLDPIADRLERWGCSRTIAVSIITGVVILVLVLALIGFIPLVQNQISDFAQVLPGYIDSLKAFALPYVIEIRASLFDGNPSELRDSVGGYVERAAGWIGTLLSEIISGGAALINLTSLLFITPIVAFYLLRDWDRLVEQIDSYLPRHHAQTIREIVRDIDTTLARFVRGTGTVCLVLGVFYAIALSIVGLQLGVVIGLTAGLISFVPYLGSIVGLIFSVGMAFAQFSEWQPIAIVAGVFALGQVLEGNVLTPKLVGGSVGLHPVWVIFAILAGGTVFGFVGVLLAVPVAAVVGVLARFSLRQYQDSPVFLGPATSQPPPADGETTPLSSTAAAEVLPVGGAHDPSTETPTGDDRAERTGEDPK
ncbi:MAG: AI-2E family transporter [Pseudomonadota bacterium]